MPSLMTPGDRNILWYLCNRVFKLFLVVSMNCSKIATCMLEWLYDCGVWLFITCRVCVLLNGGSNDAHHVFVSCCMW